MALRDMEYDRPRLEEREIAFFVGRNLTERMKHTMRGFLHLTEREKSNVVRLAHFFKCPANAHVTRQSSAAIGRLFKSGDGGNHRNAPGDCMLAATRLAFQHRQYFGARSGGMHEKRQRVTRACPLQGATRGIDFSHSEGQGRLGQPGTQQCIANDTRDLPLLPATKVSLVLLYNHEVRMELRGDPRQLLDLRVAPIAGMP